MMAKLELGKLERGLLNRQTNEPFRQTVADTRKSRILLNTSVLCYAKFGS